MKEMLKFFKVNEKGLSAVELIIALAISLLVVAAAGFILLTQSGVIRLNKSVSTEQQRLNTAFNAVRYSLRMVGFDYGQSYYVQTGSVPPVQVVQANYPANPYEVLVSYSAVVNNSEPCTITAVGGGAPSSEYDLGQFCNVDNFYVGQILNITNPTPTKLNPNPTPPIILCVTNVKQPPVGTYGRIQVNPGKGGVCPANPIPPEDVGGGNASSVNQILFYWGNYGTPGQPPTYYKFNAPFNKPGNLYECMVNPVQLEPPAKPAIATYTAPTCAANTTITLSDYINNFTVTPQGYNFSSPLPYYITSTSPAGQIEVYYSNGTNIPEPPYLNLSITGESNVALSDSPAYSVNVPYNSNAGGVGAKGNAGQIVGNNVLKTLNSSVFLRNVYYGS